MPTLIFVYDDTITHAVVPVGEAENRALEDAILTRARQMRIAQASRQG